ncbi:DNA-binding NtrC family response regulator [Pedobacter sp. UYP30]|uniref:sigma 54-interacting transcriptional regulator n=1 Tax=Pedobacter sp. UYP30 TaxID=1756400 RepID=UPI0033926C1B
MEKKILIVEDEFIVADDLQLTLQQAGYQVCGIASSFKEAKLLIESTKPSLVLLDIQLMGEKNGIDLAQELKVKNIPFVFLSANSNQTILEKAKLTEPFGFLVKPFREKDLLVALEIAFYRYEHSFESKWRREHDMRVDLTDIISRKENRRDRLALMARALQKYIPFDCITGILKNKDSGDLSFFAQHRIGFDDYQYIGINELVEMSGEKLSHLTTLLGTGSSSGDVAFQNGDEFRKMLKKNPINALFAKLFGFSSNLELTFNDSHGDIFSLNLFRRKFNGFDQIQLDLLLSLQSTLTFILSDISNEEVSAKVTALIPYGKNQPSKELFKGIIGKSSSLLNVMDLVCQVACLDTSVLLLGESGTGKERIADSIHQLSLRKNKQFIKINCAALPSTLFESELFGHEKGAFTGAIDKRIGKFELAEGGTIFLDEIGEMPLELQVKLLRVLQEREIERIGGRQPIEIDVRVIAATNRNLEYEMAEGRFRLDLYYRLNVFPIYLPSLRERKEDIEELAVFFVKKFCSKFQRPVPIVSEIMLSQLKAYHWPGNIRELENVIEQALVVNVPGTDLALRQPLPRELVKAVEKTEPEEFTAVKTIEEIKKMQRKTEIDYITAVLKETNGRIRGKNGAAEILQEKPTTLESRISKLGIKREDFS